MRTYLFEISRFTPASGKSEDRFQVALDDRMTVLDALFRIQREHDSSLAFRCSCRVGMCGTCALYINRVPRLACKTRACLLDSEVISVAPLPHFPVIKDLTVSLEPFFEQWKRVFPAFQPLHENRLKPARIPEDSAYWQATKGKHDCITCGAGFAACGIKGTNQSYLGPAAINKAFLRLMDPRDGRAEDRLAVLNQERAGIWRCHTQFNCVAACPKGISLTDSIVRLKRAMLAPWKLKRKPNLEDA